MAAETDLATIAARTDVIELAGRIVADPGRARVSTADQLALANAVELFWAICLEAEILARAVELAAGEPRELALKSQAAECRRLMNRIITSRGTENSDGRAAG